MPIEFSVAECIRLSELGKFTLCHFTGELGAADTDWLKTTLSVPSGHKIITERFNWGSTSIEDKVEYELHTEKGYHCGARICQSNQDNLCTHIVTAERLVVWLKNVSSPAEAVRYDFTVWYYRYPMFNEPKVMEILEKRDRLLEEIALYLKYLVIAQAPELAAVLIKRPVKEAIEEAIEEAARRLSRGVSSGIR